MWLLKWYSLVSSISHYSPWHEVSIPGFNFCWLALYGCNVYGKSGVTALLCHDEKITREYKLVRCLEALRCSCQLTEWLIFLFTWLLKTNSMFFEYMSEYESASQICVWKTFHKYFVWIFQKQPFADIL